MVRQLTKAAGNGGLASVSSGSTGAPNSIAPLAVGCARRFARRRPVNRGVGRSQISGATMSSLPSKNGATIWTRHSARFWCSTNGTTPNSSSKTKNRATPKRSSNWLSLWLPAIVHDIDRRYLRTRIGGTGPKLACSECAAKKTLQVSAWRRRLNFDGAVPVLQMNISGVARKRI